MNPGAWLGLNTMEQGYKLKSFPYCEKCSYLGEKIQKQYQTDIKYMLPFCKYYQLHFASVRQIKDEIEYCPHFDEGYL